MSGDEAAARRPGAPRREPVGPDPLVARRLRLATVVGASAALVAIGVAGIGLLVPAGDSPPLLRVAGALVATAAAGVLVRLDHAARAVSALAVVAFAGLLVCLATLPASPVALGGDSSGPDAGMPPTDGSGRFGTVDGEAGADGARDGAAPGPPAIGLPSGADLRVEAGNVLLGLPDGATVVLGRADAADPATMPPADTALAVVDGVAARGDGGAIGEGVALGGTTFERGDGSRVVVGDSSLLEVPSPLEPTDDAEGLDALLAVLLGCFALIAFAPPVVRFADGRSPTVLDPHDARRPQPDAPVGNATTMEDGLASVLRSMLADPEPRTAVIGAYGRLLAALAEAGAPRRDEEGPHEHLWRSLGPLGVRRAPVHRLAELFVQARFTPRPVTEAQRQAAIAALADAVADLRLQATDVREAAAHAGVATADAAT